MKKIINLIFFFFVVCLFSSCQKDIAPAGNPPTPPQPLLNLIQNPSFEDVGGKLRYNGGGLIVL